MRAYAGIDLHSSNNYIGIMDQDYKRLFGRRQPNDLNNVLKALKPFKADLEGVIVESTYNWYWLVDGLQEHGYKVHLANPSAIKQYEGIKHTDDKWDSFWLAHMKHLNILPEGYIYPKEQRAVRDLLRRRLLFEQRPVRDLLRRRLFFVRHRTANILSLQSTITRNLGIKISGNDIKKLHLDDAGNLFDSSNLVFMAQNNISTIKHLGKIIKGIEKEVKSQVKFRKEFVMLTTIPGIGIILKKGENNKKNGNKYLAWAYVEAAHFAKRYIPKAQRFYQQKMAKANGAVATKALANKLARASYFIMRDQVSFDEDLLFR
ncbi:MAG: transposase [Deltaproteobacteria bacterium]|nr:transposase [Deltaproteobacteria bacterium]